MHFIRLPGCTVGRPVEGAPLVSSFEGASKVPAWQCQAFSGEKFWCDTDFHRYLEEEADTIFSDTWEKHICLTGGEPLMHRKVVDFFRTQCQLRMITLHIETSGTIDFWWENTLHSEYAWNKLDPWITVSPKMGWTPYMIKYAQEIKLLIDKDFDEKHLDVAFAKHQRVYLSPINNVGSGGLYHPDSTTARDKCFELLKSHPDWKLSIQTHKYLSLR
jgi:organic radical activating enzyme